LPLIRTLALVGILSITACDEAVTDGTDLPAGTSWTGRIDGHAQFESDWEVVPYCSGPVQVDVDPVGQAVLSGSCTILWGPVRDTVFQVSGTGTVSEGRGSLEVSFLANPDIRGFDPVTVQGSVDGGLILQGDTRYRSEIGDVDEVGLVIVRLERAAP